MILTTDSCRKLKFQRTGAPDCETGPAPAAPERPAPFLLDFNVPPAGFAQGGERGFGARGFSLPAEKIFAPVIPTRRSDPATGPVPDVASMPAPPAPVLSRLISLRTTDGGLIDWHTHPFEQLMLVTDDRCMVGCPPGWQETQADTLLHYHAGECHGSWSPPGRQPRFWIVHYYVDATLYHQPGRLGAFGPARRIWNLTPGQSETFRWMFMQMHSEHSSGRPYAEQVASAWLQLLLVTMQRWGNPAEESGTVVPPRASAEVLRLWHLINAGVHKSRDELQELYAAPNYDSVRHAFGKAFGCSPRKMLQRLRMAHAKNLLIESSLSIKEISSRVGCQHQHDFNRLFRRLVGVAPSKWRANLLAGSIHP